MTMQLVLFLPLALAALALLAVLVWGELTEPGLGIFLLVAIAFVGMAIAVAGEVLWGLAGYLAGGLV